MTGRNIPRYSRQHHTIHLCSRKMGCTIKVESFAELFYAYQCEFIKNVKQYTSQPASFNLLIDNKKARYTPDFLVEMNDGTVKFVEVHALTKINEKYAKKLACFQKMAVASGWEFELVDARKIGVSEQQYLHNCARINSIRTECLPESITRLPLPSVVSFGELISILKEHSSTPTQDAMAMLAAGVYKIPYQDLVSLVMLSRGDA